MGRGRELDYAEKVQMGTDHYPQCPVCGRNMVRANVGTTAREQSRLVCCDPRCWGRADEPEDG